MSRANYVRISSAPDSITYTTITDLIDRIVVIVTVFGRFQSNDEPYRSIHWPSGDQVSVTVEGLPESNADRSRIQQGLRAALEHKNDQGRMLLPVRRIRFGDDMIVIIADVARADLTRLYQEV